MTKLAGLVSLVAAGCLAAGFYAGYFAGVAKGTRSIESARGAPPPAEDVSSPEPGARDASRPGARRTASGKDFESPQEEENPLRNEPTETLLAILNASPREANERDRDLAMHALLARVREDPLGAAALLPSITRGGILHAVCRELAVHGGEEGILAVTSFITNTTGDIERRMEAIHALAGLPEDRAPAGRSALLGLMQESFPEEMQHTLCSAYGEACGDRAVTSLLELARGTDHALRSEIVLDALGRFGTAADAPGLLTLLEEGTWTSQERAAILRSAGRASGSGDVLLGLLSALPQGVSAEAVARAFAEAAPSLKVDAEAVLNLLGRELPANAKAELARGLVRASGDDGMQLLLERVRNDPSSVDPEALGAALAAAQRKDLVPAMLETMGSVKNFETLHQLARGIVAASGHEGVEALIGLIESGTLAEGRLHPLCGALAEAGTAEDAASLFGLIEKIRDPEGARALMKAAVNLAGEGGNAQCATLLGRADDGDVRAAAADVLGHRGAAAYLPNLVDALAQEEFGRAQWHITRAIAMAGEDGVQQLDEFFARDANEPRKHEMLNALAYMEGFDSTRFLAEALLSDRSGGIRSHAAEILAKKADDAALALLAQAAGREGDAEVRAAINAALDAAKKRRE
ncbi:MAG TPA: hypothetical protein DCM87_06440 [Planctomycetes bacterium]|nr:hypothetical protein [Planctomycetota bacterium]